MERWRDSEWVERMTVHLNYSRVMSGFTGSSTGITEAELDALAPVTEEIAAAIESRRSSGEWGFFDLPYDTDTAAEVLELAGRFKNRCDDFIVLGIGGSALGGVALFRALCHPHHNLLPKKDRQGRPRLFFLDNIDPPAIKSVLDLINPEKSVFNVITKSGTTVETLSQAVVARKLIEDRLGRESVKEHFVITTGASRGYLAGLVEADCPRLSIPENVGGRFSVFTPVGLFPAVMAGIDIMELLAGARHMDGLCHTSRLRQNPAYLSGALHYLAYLKKGLDIAVMMPYSEALVPTAQWFQQLWAESLGKAVNTAGETVNTGQTPLAATGVTDQHSLLQLFLEGPADKLVTFLTVEDHGREVAIPGQANRYEEVAYLGGHSLGELMNVEARATEAALTRAGRSSLRITLPEINPFTLGQLLCLLEVQTAFTGCLLDINPMDQPGVEAIKGYIYGMMGRKGHSDKVGDIKDWQEREKRYSV